MAVVGAQDAKGIFFSIVSFFTILMIMYDDRLRLRVAMHGNTTRQHTPTPFFCYFSLFRCSSSGSTPLHGGFILF